MARFLIEVQHEPEVVACAKVVKVFLSTGSHLLTHADWGCMDGIHSAWLIVDVDRKEDALQVVPPALRSKATIVALHKFTIEQVDSILKQHRAP